MKFFAQLALSILIISGGMDLFAEDGYKLWLRYAPISDQSRYESVKLVLDHAYVSGSSSTVEVIKEELIRASKGLLGKDPVFPRDNSEQLSLIIGTPATNKSLDREDIQIQLRSLGPDGYYMGYLTSNGKGPLVLAANTDVGALYGTFHLLRLLQASGRPTDLPIIESPGIKHRILNHWDNLDGTVERGYAGFSIWNWHKLPRYIDPRYKDYARANASLGINGSVVTNVNANAFALTPAYLKKVAALADVFRPYGIQIYLTARFSSPMDIGGLSTADPLDREVRAWWKLKVDEIYKNIPDFGGFVVKANSEGQPGPQNYERSHADGANMLAEAVRPHGGIVMWRAFVYSADIEVDRAKQANYEFVPYDGKFLDNVVIQVKNGAIDFQPREPFHPLFGAMPKTPLALELQITQEYLGQGSHLVYLAPLFKECLEADTYRPEEGSTVARVIDGKVYGNELSAIAGVSNIGTDRNWTGHLFGQANWFAFGRLAWDHQTSSEQISSEWIKLTFGDDPFLVDQIQEIMMLSREAVVNYMTPLGLHHIMGRNHHFGPGPWVDGGRPDWTSVYYHKADSLGIGFDRTASGSDALSQYATEIENLSSDPGSCPDEYLLWFHHLPWDYPMKSGKSLWDELCLKYDQGVKEVRQMKVSWEYLEELLDPERFKHVSSLLDIQEEEASWWRNVCLLYFQQFSRRPFPVEIEQPVGDLKYYQELSFPYAPGIRPSW